MSGLKPAISAPGVLIRSARLTAAIGGLALASTGEMQAPVVISFLAFFLIGLRIASAPAAERAMSVLQPYLAVALFAIAIMDFFQLSQSFLLAAAHFLLGLQAIRLLALRTARENLGSALIASLTMLSAATLAVDWTFFLMLLVFLPLVIWTLMLHTVVMDGHAGMDERSPAWRELAGSLRRAAAAAFAVTALCCAVVFAAFPRFNLQGFRGQFLQPVHTTGFSNEVNLSKAGRIFSDDSVIMRIEIDPADRGLWPGYVRGGVLDAFDGLTWKRAPRPAERLFSVGRREFRTAHSESPKRLRQSIYLESMDSPILFGAPRIVHVKIDRPFLERYPDGTVQRAHGDAWRIHYDVISAIEDNGAPGGRPPVLSRPEYLQCTSVPEHVDAAKRLAERVGGRGSVPVVAERLAEHLRSNYAYSLTLPAPKGKHPIDNFLEHTRSGHCEYFASALALALRYRGVPARLVTGFLTDEWNPQGNYYVVRMRDAHAWVEYFDPERGWVAIDPSPRDTAPADSAVSALRQKMGEGWDFLNLRWNRYILSYDIERQVAVIRTVTSGTGRMSLRLERAVIDIRRWKIFGGAGRDRSPSQATDTLKISLLPVIGVALLAGGIWALWSFLRRRDDRVWFLPPLLKHLEKRGAAPSPSKTLREVVSAAPALGNDREHVKYLENEYYRTRFDPAHRTTREERKKIRRALAALKS